MSKDFLVGGLSNIPRGSLVTYLVCIIVLNLNTQMTAKTNMSIDIVISVTAFSNVSEVFFGMPS